MADQEEVDRLVYLDALFLGVEPVGDLADPAKDLPDQAGFLHDLTAGRLFEGLPFFETSLRQGPDASPPQGDETDLDFAVVLAKNDSAG
ncbi:hypothetical protein D3C86_1351960 [compost metagenome]